MIAKEIHRVVGALPKNMSPHDFFYTMRAVYLAVDDVRPTKQECHELWQLYWGMGKTTLDKCAVLRFLLRKYATDRIFKINFETYDGRYNMYTINRNNKIVWQN